MEIKVGDWITSNSSGIWMVYRVLDNVLVANSSGSPEAQSVIFSSRFLNAKYKPSFKSEGCSPSLVSLLNDEASEKLHDFILSNPVSYDKFKSREPKSTDRFHDAFISKPEELTASEVANLFDINEKYKASEINAALNDLKLTWQGKSNWRIEFICEDHECINGELVYKFNEVLEF